MITLGIETSCDETGIAVTHNGKVLSNAVSSSVHLHKKYGGVVPGIASRLHVEYIVEVLDRALEKSGKELEDIGLIAVTNGPGLVGALLIGISMAKALSYELGVPLIGVNHILAHMYSAFLNDDDRPRFPFIGLVVSGGHTALFYCEDIDKQKLLGQTQDDAVGEAFDKVAKILKLGYPGGPEIERTARGSVKKEKKLFPKSFMGKESLDFSFSGTKTAVLYHVRDLEKRCSGPLPEGVVSDICYAFQESALDTLVEKAFLAAKLKKSGRIVIGGGVAANSRLREKFTRRAELSEGVKVYFPKFEYSIDNGAMIASLGEELYKKGYKSDYYLTAEPNLEI